VLLYVLDLLGMVVVVGLRLLAIRWNMHLPTIERNAGAR
jgi:uncharacterized membrane protein YeiH